MYTKLSIGIIILLVTGCLILACSDDNEKSPVVGPGDNLLSGQISVFVYDSVYQHSWDTTVNFFANFPLQNAVVYCIYPHPDIDDLAVIIKETDNTGRCDFDLDVTSVTDTISVFAELYDRTSEIKYLTLNKDDDYLDVRLMRSTYIIEADCTSIVLPEEQIPAKAMD